MRGVDDNLKAASEETNAILELEAIAIKLWLELESCAINSEPTRPGPMSATFILFYFTFF